MGLFDKLFGKKEKAEEAKEELKEGLKEKEQEIIEISKEIKEKDEIIDKRIEEIREEVNEKVNMSERLTKSKQGFFAKLKNIFSSKSKISESIYEELEDLLIQSDIGLNMTTKIIEKLEKEVKNKKITETSEVYDLLKELMTNFLIIENNKIELRDGELNVILIVGVNGVGKTTTIGKLASKYKKMGKKVLLGAGDTFRAAAVEQLEEWAKRADVDIVKGKEGVDPASVVFDTLTKANEIKADVVIIDTAGRLHNKANLMRELEKINSIIKRKIGEQRYESILVIDGTTGQNGLNQAKEFNEVTNLTGFIVTKLDGTAKGGIVFAVSEELQKPIKFIGLGEKINDLVEFDAREFIAAIFEN
ncbi:signal recognition particle-docking protein FtsY [Fusobacterium gastrosuis]|uniref:signal recognition particle-docking protein FtsY n=1 Tax=Fusobacterium gastrosuis TaxID=1755100 RepID=UPI002971DBCA|nr:signal recognition particle-docking protein FtsY [Fusobacteriaceae bacterium]MDY5713750.1 signal recognition particle-docking protein FtsY [Fusobacterium gastrosuis]